MFSLRTLCVIATAFATLACDEAASDVELEVAPRVAELSPAAAEALCADLEAAFVPAGERFACALETTLLSVDEDTCERQRLRCEPEKPGVCPYRDAAVRSSCPASVDAVMACFEALGQGFEAGADALSCSVLSDRASKTAAFERLEGLLAVPEACKALPAACLPQDEEEAPEEPAVEEPEVEEVPEAPTVEAETFGLIIVADAEIELCSIRVTCSGEFQLTEFGGYVSFEGDDFDRAMQGENVCDQGSGGLIPPGGAFSALYLGDRTDCTAQLEVRGGDYQVYHCVDSTALECLAGEPQLVPAGTLEMTL